MFQRAKTSCMRRGVHAEQGPLDLIGFADQLHVAVFDPVVDHLDVVPRTFEADPVAAGGAVVDLGGDRLKDRLDVRPGVGVAAGHDRRPLEAPSSPPETPVPMNWRPLGLEVSGPAGGVGVVGIASVDQDVAGVEQGTSSSMT